jgi:hypothetical protein
VRRDHHDQRLRVDWEDRVIFAGLVVTVLAITAGLL